MAGPTQPTDRTNVTDTEQTVIEEAEFEGGAPVFDDGKTRVVAKGAQTATQKTSNGGSNIGSNAGVVMQHDDNPGVFLGDTQGKP
jgi:hypothetical protein